MRYFYDRSVCAFFLGDGKHARKKAYSLYRRLGMRSFIVDERPSLRSRICPFITAVSSAAARDDRLFLDLIDSLIERCGRPVLLLIVGDPAARGPIERNKDFFQSRFITDQSIISEITQ